MSCVLRIDQSSMRWMPLGSSERLHWIVGHFGIQKRTSQSARCGYFSVSLPRSIRLFTANIEEWVTTPRPLFFTAGSWRNRCVSCAFLLFWKCCSPYSLQMSSKTPSSHHSVHSEFWLSMLWFRVSLLFLWFLFALVAFLHVLGTFSRQWIWSDLFFCNLKATIVGMVFSSKQRTQQFLGGKVLCYPGFVSTTQFDFGSKIWAVKL